jgi:hypothetical protein
VVVLTRIQGVRGLMIFRVVGVRFGKVEKLQKNLFLDLFLYRYNYLKSLYISRVNHIYYG